MISESAPVFYILGIDREKVAAGLAIKFEKLVPYLRGMAEGSELYYGLEFGFSFLEKFIQIPFEVPHPALNDIRKLLKSLQSENTSPAENTTESGASLPLNPGLLVQLGPDSETVLLVVEMVTPYLEFNPRRVKQFLNLFRLRALLASQTGLFGQPRSREFDPLTLFQLGKITAISLCWSGLIADLQTSPKLLSELQELASSKGSEPKSVEAKRWASQSRLMKLIAYGASEGDFSATVPFNEESFDSRITRVREYGLYRVDVERLLRIAPPLQRFSPSENMKVTKTEMSESKHPRTGDWERDWSEEGSGVEYRPRSRKKSPIDIQDLSDDPGSN